MTPAKIILLRNRAFSDGDFGLIYDSYHPDSNFRRQFPDRNEYIQIGRNTLSHDYRIVKCQILDEAITGQEARIIFFMQITANEQTLRYAELAWFLKHKGQWRYHRGQKMTNDELPENPESIGFNDFERLDSATIF